MLGLEFGKLIINDLYVDLELDTFTHLPEVVEALLRFSMLMVWTQS